MVEYIRNAVFETCEECGKTVAYEKDDDGGLAAVETTPYVWLKLCEECANVYAVREAYLRE